MAKSLKGFNNLVATFESDINVSVGDVVAIAQNGNAKVASANDDILGVCVSANGNTIGVLVEGYVEVKYDGTAPSTGYKNILASSKTSVAVKDTPVAGKNRLVLKVDTANKKIGFIL